jgi:hypothetical protein
MDQAFVMSVNPGQEKEYEKRHNPILSLGRWQVPEQVRGPFQPPAVSVGHLLKKIAVYFNSVRPY